MLTNITFKQQKVKQIFNTIYAWTVSIDITGIGAPLIMPIPQSLMVDSWR